MGNTNIFPKSLWLNVVLVSGFASVTVFFKETVVLRRWGSCTQKFGFINRVVLS